MAILQLENFIFGHLEVPSSILGIGGEQNEFTHQLPGGARSVNAMGPSWNDLSWSGYFDGITALDRARYLYNLWVQGLQYKCTFSSFNYLVLIKRFSFDYQFLPIPFSITLRVIQDLTVPIKVLAPLSFDDAILDAIYEALTLAELVEDGGLIGAIAAALGAMNALSSISGATSAELANIGSLVNSASSTAANLSSSIQKSLFPS